MIDIRLEPNPTAWDLKWSMFRIPVRVHPLFWLTTLLIWFDSDTRFSYVLVAIACVFLAILIHELGHAFAQRHYGDRESHIVIYYFGGLTIGSINPSSYLARILISLWGPGAGFILGGVAYAFVLLIRYSVIPEPESHVMVALDVLVWVSVIWGAVNLLPVFPLDGGQITRELIHRKAPQRGDVLAFGISFYVALLACLGFLGYFIYERSSGVQGSLLGAVFFGVLAYSSYRLWRQVRAFGGSYEDEGPRQAWERDADWWKRS
jgi:Zn-dependent protease